jgi:hypothetical protein
MDQHPQRHLIRPHHHTLAHERRPCQLHDPERPRHTDQESTGQRALDQLKKMGYNVTLSPVETAVAG